MTYLLDTNVVTEVSKLVPNPDCLTWLSSRKGECALSTITLAEIRFGFERLANGKRKAALEPAYQFLLEDYAGQLFDFDGPSASEWGRYAAELEAEYGSDWWKHFDLRDTQIGAIAREYGLIVATRNAKHFPFCKTENPFASP